MVASANAGNRVLFTENKGQLVDESGKLRNDILYTAESKGVKLFFFNNTVSFLFSEIKLKEHSKCQIPDKRQMEDKIESAKYYRMDMEFVNANTNCTVIGEDYTSDYMNYYYAHCPNGITNVRNSRKIIYHNLYTNIDVVYYGIEDGSIKYDIVVKPGGNPNDVQLKYNGASNISIAKNGALQIKNPLGEIIEQAPYTYQILKTKKEIETHFEIENNTVRFKVANYDTSQTLVIDPWATYYGGNDIEQCSNITSDSQFNAVVTGFTDSKNFPVSIGSFQTMWTGAPDVFILKFNSVGKRLWATYYGGIGAEYGHSIATDKLDNILITGQTRGVALINNFPISVGAFQPNHSGVFNSDCFIIKLNPNGTRLWATFYGALGEDIGYGISTDENNNVIVVGMTDSQNFPVSNGSFQIYHNAVNKTAFVLKFDSNGNRLWATFYGGNNFEEAFSVAIDKSNNIFFTGYTESSSFPKTNGAYQPTLAGKRDAFLVKLNSDGNQIFSTYVGGTEDDWGNGIDVDNNNNVVISGTTYSQDFSVTNESYQNVYLGNGDEFILKFDNNGVRIWSTFFGGSDNDYHYGYGNSLAIDSCNRIAFTGNTFSLNYPLTEDATQSGLVGLSNLFITLLDENGNLIFSTYYGCEWVEARSIIIGEDNSFLVVGYTDCESFPFSTDAFQKTYGGGGDGFIINVKGEICLTTDTCVKELNIPNIFTPNNDKENNTFKIAVNCSKQYQITIYNRWGLKVFETTNANEYWDGTLMNEGKETPEGTYYYILNITDDKDVAALYKGFLTLLR